MAQEIEQKVNDMPITYDIKTDGLYNRGREEGREEGNSKRQRRRHGKTKKEISLNLIKADLDNDTISKATSLSTEKIETLRKGD